MFDFLGLKKTLSDVAGQVSELRSQIEKLQRQREDIATAPATREDVKAMVTSWVAGRSAEYVKRLQFNMQEIVSNPSDFQDENAVNGRMTLFGRTRQQGGLGMFPGPELEDMAICCLMGPALVKSLHETIDSMDNWPKGGIPMRDRAKEIQKLDEKISRLVEQESSIVSAAADAGVRIGA